MSTIAERWGQFVTTWSRPIIVVLVLLTVLFAFGIPMVEQQRDLGQFESDSPAVNASEFIENGFLNDTTDNVTPVQIVRFGEDGEDVLTQEDMIASLEFQQEIQSEAEIGPMVVENESITGVANVLSLYRISNLLLGLQTENGTAIDLDDFDEFEHPDNLSDADRTFLKELIGVETLPPRICFEDLADREMALSLQQEPPPLDCQIWAIEEMDTATFNETIEQVLGTNGEREALGLMPESYEPGSTTAQAHAMFLLQETQGGALENPDGFSENVTSAQFDLRNRAIAQDGQYRTFGFALLDTELQRSLEDSTFIVIPVALLFVFIVLMFVYRDLYDILLGAGGILAVLCWTVGFMGWAGIPFNQMIIAVPALLIGLSIDYSLHVSMRHREHRTERHDSRQAMAAALGGVTIALAWVTATTSIGFLSNLVSPIGPLRDFGITSTAGILASFIIFGALIPALKVELDEYLENRGQDRRKEAFGTGNSRVGRILGIGATLARRAPIAVLIVALLVSAGGAYGAMQVDTNFEERNFLAEDAPAWMQELPGPFAASEYQIADDMLFIQEHFQQFGRQGELVIRGNVTHNETLSWIDSTGRYAAERNSTFVLPNGKPDVRSPLSAMRNTVRYTPGSEFNASFNEVSGDDGVPRSNLEPLYDQTTALNPGSDDLFYRNSGEYRALRMQVGFDGEASQSEATNDLEAIAAYMESESDGEVSVVATGQLIINNEIEENLYQTVIQSLIVTLLVVFAFLAIAYKLTGNTASLGIITLLPVLCTMTWILGTMWLLGLSFNALTGTISALTIGLGIDYSIHISDRYQLELQRQDSVGEALHTTVTGTGGALLGTAATTVGGFWTLSLAMMPALEQFGLIIGITIVYAFLASVLVLPSLLVLWTRYLRPANHIESAGTMGDGPTATHDD